MNTTQIKRFDKITKVLCSSAIKMTLRTDRLNNGYRKLFVFDNGVQASVICHDGVSNNMDGNPIEIALIRNQHQNSYAVFDEDIKVFYDVEDVNEYLLEIAETPSWVL